VLRKITDEVPNEAIQGRRGHGKDRRKLSGSRCTG
jgi:hypothetical protein